MVVGDEDEDEDEGVQEVMEVVVEGEWAGGRIYGDETVEIRVDVQGKEE